jgi:ribosome-associated translation inhibitor RaiA
VVRDVVALAIKVKNIINEQKEEDMVMAMARAMARARKVLKKIKNKFCIM